MFRHDPPRSDTLLPASKRACLLIMLTMPPPDPRPYSTAAGPFRISMRSTLAVLRRT